MQVASVDWWLDVDYREKRFQGKVRIAFEGAEDPLVLDCERLSLESASLDGRPVVFHEDASSGTISLVGVSPAAHALEIAYRGAVDPKSLVGMYLAPAAGSYVLTTMLFPTGSRRLLPSFEHPSVKTIYRLTLSTEADLHVVFNTPPRSQRTLDGRKEWVFEPTPRMSAYLLYLGIGPFDTLSVPGGRWTVTVDAPPGRAASGRYLAERASEVLAAYEQYFGIAYPLPKLDLVALENFWAGAMENWGAIAFRDEAVLLGPSTGVRLRRAMLDILAHEIAHQWFGNLVTNAWWDDFWLNESFATFVSFRIIARRYPEDDPWKSMLVNWVSAGLDLDGLDSTHPIRVPVRNASELGENADMITYGKGAAVLRMIEAYLGEETFRRGVSRYLERYQYSNARAEDLWSALGEVAEAPVPRVMTAWITRPGFPLLRAEWSDGHLRLEQSRFRSDGAPAAGVWPIPLRLRTDGEERRILFDDPGMDLPVRSIHGLRIDPGRHAFVRIQYGGALLDEMLREFPEMDPTDAWGFVNDLGALVYAGSAPFDRVLELVRRSEGLRDDFPIRALVALLEDLRVPAHGVPAFAQAAQKFLAAQLDRIGREGGAGEPETQTLLRELIVNLRVRLDLDFARELAALFPRIDELPASIRYGVLVGHARADGVRGFEEIVHRLRSTDQAAERALDLGALGWCADRECLARALALIPSEGVTPAGALLLLESMAGNPAAGSVLFDWYREKIGALTEMWAGTPLQSEFLHYGLPGLGLDREEAVRSFLEAHTPPDSVAGARAGLESLALTSRLRRVVTGPR